MTGRHDSTDTASDTAGRRNGPTGDEGNGQRMRYDGIGGYGTEGATGDTTQEDKDMGAIDMDTDMNMNTDMGFETGMTVGKPRKAYAFEGLGLRDDEACLAATMRAEELGLHGPHDAEVLRKDELTSYVLLKAGDKTDILVPAPFPEGMPTLGGNETSEDTVRHGSPQILIGVTCGIDENGCVRAYAGAPFPATRRNIESITQSCDGTRRYASSRFLETEWPGGIIYDYAPSRYLYGGETRLMQICDIERILACDAEQLATPGGSLIIPTDPTPLDAFEPIIETATMLTVATGDMLLIMQKEGYYNGLYDAAWLPDTETNREIVKAGAAEDGRPENAVEMVIEKHGTVEFPGHGDEEYDAWDETLYTVSMEIGN